LYVCGRGYRILLQRLPSVEPLRACVLHARIPIRLRNQIRSHPTSPSIHVFADLHPTSEMISRAASGIALCDTYQCLLTLHSSYHTHDSRRGFQGEPSVQFAMCEKASAAAALLAANGDTSL
jgi:hypothetical protein